MRVHDFYNARRGQLQESHVEPNAAHYALARLEAEWRAGLLVTQNIDDLHERAGSKTLIHMHGELLSGRCEHCGQCILGGPNDLSSTCPSCQRTSGMRPNVVWFGEMPLQMDQIYEALDDCALFLSIGTSGNVYPAAGFVQEVKLRGQGHTVELNLELSEGATLFDETVHGPATQIVPAYIDQLLQANAAA